MEHPTSPGVGFGIGLGVGIAIPCRIKTLRAPGMEGALTPPPEADAADPECLGRMAPVLSLHAVPSSGVTPSALADHLPVPWHRTGIFQGFFPVPFHTPAPAGSQGCGISQAAALDHVASFWELLGGHFSHQPCPSFTPCPAPHRLCKGGSFQSQGEVEILEHFYELL